MFQYFTILKIMFHCFAMVVLVGKPQKEWKGLTEVIRENVRKMEKECESKKYKGRKKAVMWRSSLLTRSRMEVTYTNSITLI